VNEQRLPLISVIITTRNEERNIAACLNAVWAQSAARDAFEIILVDNNSTDRTVELARPLLDQLVVCGPERSAQRNEGVRIARAPVVMYLDADMRLSPTVVEECLAMLEAQPDVVALYIPEVVIGSGYWIRVRNFERGFYDATVIDAVRVVRRNVFLAMGGFDLTLCGPEDWDLDRRLMQQGTLRLIRAPLYHDEGAFNLRRYVRKKMYYARSFTAYAAKWNNDAIVRKQLGAWYRFVGVFIEEGKWRRLLRHPWLTAGMYLLRALVGSAFLWTRLRARSSKPNS
jgi:glycosyltransferase involved in cell wall biosynthesis